MVFVGLGRLIGGRASSGSSSLERLHGMTLEWPVKERHIEMGLHCYRELSRKAKKLSIDNGRLVENIALRSSGHLVLSLLP